MTLGGNTTLDGNTTLANTTVPNSTVGNMTIANTTASPAVQFPLERLTDLTRAPTDSWNIVRIACGRNNNLHQIVPSNNGTVLKVFYPRGSYTPSALPQGGIGFFASPSHTFMAEDVVLRYQVAFHDNWDPVKGGKLPGLFVGRGQTSADMTGATGGCQTDNGSLRLTWRPPSTPGQGMTAEAYVYVPGEIQDPSYYAMLTQPRAISSSIVTSPTCSSVTKIYGDSLWRGSFTLRKGVNNYNDVEARVRMNSIVNGVPQKDGLLTVTINGVTQRFDKLIWRVDNTYKVNAMLFSTFFGGSTPEWATPNDTWSYFRNMSVQKLA